MYFLPNMSVNYMKILKNVELKAVKMCRIICLLIIRLID